MILNDFFLLNYMKKVEAVIQAVREQDVVNALTELKIGGFTVLHGKGCGKSPKLEYGDPFTNILTVFTVVEDSKVDQVVSAISKSAHMGTTGDGKIFVSPVNEVTDISTNKKGERYL